MPVYGPNIEDVLKPDYLERSLRQNYPQYAPQFSQAQQWVQSHPEQLDSWRQSFGNGGSSIESLGSMLSQAAPQYAGQINSSVNLLTDWVENHKDQLDSWRQNYPEMAPYLSWFQNSNQNIGVPG